MVTVKLYVEGGGDSEALHRRCREGFRGFLKKAGFTGRMPRIVACGGRQAAYDRFSTACSANETALLLIDSEEAISTGTSPWTHLANRPGDGFAKPANTTDDHCHLMVVCMESWFLADKDALSGFFDPGFNGNALPQHTNIEAVSKTDIYNGLQRATSNCKTKAPYGKGEHSFKILLHIAPDKVSAASPWARRFLETLQKVMDGK
ncbi:MAG: DUF4276 family protein [Candidatus Hydrogenedentota bacterium]